MSECAAHRLGIARGAAGDCCVDCGRVGISLPDDHDCSPGRGLGWARRPVDPPMRRLDWNDRAAQRRSDPVTAAIRAAEEAPPASREDILRAAGLTDDDIAVILEALNG